MSSGESDSNVDSVDNFDSDFGFINEYIFANGIQPFCFEPVHSASEISEHMNTSKEHMESDKSEQHVESESSMNSMDWCICKHYSLDRNITDKICCRNPTILQDDKFTEVDCITEIETFNLVCLKTSTKLRTKKDSTSFSRTKQYLRCIQGSINGVLYLQYIYVVVLF